MSDHAPITPDLQAETLSRGSLHAVVMRELIESVEAAMARKGWRHKDLAMTLGMSRPCVTQILSGRQDNLTVETIVRLAEALGCVPNVVLQWPKTDAYNKDEPL